MPSKKSAGPSTPTCLGCAADARALAAWSKHGGPLPPVTCTTPHLLRCQGSCRRAVLCLNEDGRCDLCWQKEEAKARPLAQLAPKEEADVARVNGPSAIEEDPAVRKAARAAAAAAAKAEFEQEGGVTL